MSEECHGFVNWETWNVDLWIDNIGWAYHSKARFLEYLDRPVTAEDAKDWVERWKPPNDLDSDDWGKVDWEDMAKNWEVERQEILGYVNEIHEDFEEVDDGEEV